jgi:sugar lactone lactonase YvrE
MKTAFSSPSHNELLPFALPRAAAVLLGTIAAAMPCLAQTPPVILPYTINTIAGTGSSGTPVNGGLATAAQLSSDLRAVAVDAQGDVYIADATNGVIREINAATGTITNVAGGATAVCSAHKTKSGDGCLAATQTILNTPRGIALDKAGNLYIAGYGDSLIHEVVKQTGMMVLIAGSVAGTGSSGTKTYSGDGGLANVAGVNAPRGVRVDNFGNIWVCDTGNNVVREINATTGIITTVVGSNANAPSAGTAGFTGDGGPAAAAELNEPTDIVFDSANNAYIVDFNNKRIREVTASNKTINTIIGNGGTQSTTAPLGPQTATTFALGSPTKIDIDTYGNLYFTDTGESVVYFYDAVAQTISVIAGEYGYAGSSTGFPVCANSSNTLGDGCPATQAVFYQGSSSAIGMALDGNNNLYITDPADARVREVSTNLSFPAGSVGVAQTQTVSLHFSVGDTPAGGVATPTGVATVPSSGGDFSVVAGSTVCSTNTLDNTSNCTAQVSFDPVDPGVRAAPLTVTSVKSHRGLPLTGTGNGALSAFDPGTASLLGSGLSSPHGSAFDAAGNLYIADTGNNRVVKISGGTQTVFAGTGTSGSGGNGGLATAATLNAPAAVAVSASGIVYIADTGNNVVRAVDPLSGNISLYAGGGTNCGQPQAVDAQGDGCPATQATLNGPAGLATDAYGNLFIADTGDNTVRRVDPRTGTIDLYAGLITSGSPYTATAICSGATDTPYGDGCAATQAAFNGPTGLTMDLSGNLFVADTGDNLIREISLGTGLVTKVAGNGQAVFAGDGGAATSASLNGPTAVREDAAGDLYIADTGNAAVRLVAAASGTISTLLGQGGTPGSTGGTGVASQLEFKSPSGLAIDSSGNLYVSDTGNSRVVEDNRNLGYLAFGSDNLNTPTPEQTATFRDTGNAALTFTNSPVYTQTGASADFLIDTSATTACSGSGIAASASCTLAAAFDPIVTGTNLTDNLTVASNAVNQSTAKLQLVGTGVQLATTTVKLVQTSPAGSLSYGQSATFTATVAPTTGSGTPTGSVTFSIDGVQQPQAVTLGAGDTATLTVTLNVGMHSIGAIYSGDSTYATSNSTLSVTVSLAGTTTGLTISAATQIFGQPVVFTANVASLTIGVPAGTVNFLNGTAVLGTATLNAQGQAVLTTSSLAIATYSVTAVYVPNSGSNYSASTSTPAQTLVINPIPPGFTATAASTTLTVPQGGTVQTVLSLLPAGGITGTVSFSCSGLPANTSCGFFPTTVSLPTLSPATDCTPSVATAVCTTLTITTNVPQIALAPPAPGTGSRGARILCAAVFLPALLLGLFQRRHRRMAMLALSVALLAGFTMLSGCASNPTQANVVPTPVGTYTVMVTMAGPDSVTVTTNLTLNVLQGTTVTAGLEPSRPVGVPVLAASLVPLQ